MEINDNFNDNSNQSNYISELKKVIINQLRVKMIVMKVKLKNSYNQL